MSHMLSLLAAAILKLPLLAADEAAAPPVVAHGELHVSGSRLVDAHRNPVVLRGCSLFWSQWQPRFWNEDCVAWLAGDWHATVIRAAVGVESGGYLAHPAIEEAKLERVIAGAKRAGIYVIVDWHDHRAAAHTAQAAAFFGRLAAKYAATPNVIFEIFNEPLGLSWHSSVKPYAEAVVHAIRAAGAPNLIIVGTPHWSQDVDTAAREPIADPNLAYSLHFYAGTHKAALRAKAERAIAMGIPLFVTEWGPCDANGSGAIDAVSTREWFAFLGRHTLSSCVWAVSDKRETASLVRPSAPGSGRWSAADLTPAGILARTFVRSEPEPGSRAP